MEFENQLTAAQEILTSGLLEELAHFFEAFNSGMLTESQILERAKRLEQRIKELLNK